MKRSLFFHIGAHRTATSAVQHYLHSNRSALKRQGFLYPFMVRRHVHTINQLFDGSRSPQQVSADLIDRMQSHEMDLHSVVLSDEDICMRQDISLLGEFRENFNVKVVFSLRRQDLWLESWYLQNIKWQWNPQLSHGTLTAFLDQREAFHWIHYDRYLRHLEKVFGRENIIVIPYERGQMPPGGAVQMFCDSIGLQPGEDFTRPATVNPSFSPQVSEFMRCLPLDAAPEKYRAMLTDACAQIDANLAADRAGRQDTEQRAPAPVLIPHPQRAQIMAAYSRGNRALARRYFDREELFFEPLPGPDRPLSEMRLPADSYQLMTEFVAPLLQAMITRRRKEVTRKHLARQAARQAAREAAGQADKQAKGQVAKQARKRSAKRGEAGEREAAQDRSDV